MERERLGTVAIAAGVLLIVGTLVVSATVAPTIGSASGADDETETIVGVQGGGPGWHEHGNVHALAGETETWMEESADSYFEVERLDNGSILAGFMHSGYEDCGPYDAPCPRTGFRVIDPSGGEPEIVYEYSFPVRTKFNSEVHAAEQLEDGGFVFTDMEEERIVVVEDGEEVWEWRASELYNEPDDPTRRDWLHINDVDAIGDDRFLVSVRNANQLVVVERGEGVVEIINEDDGGSVETCRQRDQLVPDEDGDVRCGDADVLDHQHNPQWLDDGAVLVADSDNDRVVELHRDESNGDWEVAWTLESANAVSLKWPRDADRLPNGHTLVTDTLNRRLVEVDENGSVVWSVRTERIPYEADRMPWGEPVGANRYAETGEGTPSPSNDGVPGVSLLLAGLRGAAPWLPFWFTELQLSLTILGLVLGGGGAWLRLTAGGRSLRDRLFG